MDTRELQAARRKSFAASGLCVRCGANSPRPGKQTCDCALRYDQKRRATLRAAGLCVECGGPKNDKTIRLCDDCKSRYQRRFKAKAALHQKDFTFCPKCGRQKTSQEETKWCDRCKNWCRIRARILKSEVITAYGGRCECCQEMELGFLTIDHIDGGGKKHRLDVHGKIYLWLKKHNYPPGFRVLCFNCNCGRAVNGGVCPHLQTVTSSPSHNPESSSAVP